MTSARQSPLTITVVLIGALLWGLYWLPIRELERLGLPGAWAGFALAAGAVPLLVVLALWRSGPRLSRRSIIGAAAIGGALSLYGAAIVYTDVVRAILIFYLAPAWSVLIEAVFLGRRLTWQSVAAVGIAILGITLVCRGEIPLDGIGAIGDWMALASGVSWSVAAAILFSEKAPDIRWTALTAMLSAAVISLIVILADPAVSGPMPTGEIIAVSAPMALIFGMAFSGPIILLTIWGAIRLRPATVTFLLTAEIISGVASSALLLDEPFAWWEISGTVLIVLAAVIEIVFPPFLRPKDEPQA